MSIIPEFVMVCEALGSLTHFFVERFDIQAKKLKTDDDAFRKEVIDQLERYAKTNPTLENHLRGTANAIEELVKLRNSVESTEKSKSFEDIKRFFQTYCQNMLHLEQVGLEYRSVVRNFDLKYDYRNELDFQLLDYKSDLVLVGLLILEVTESFLYNYDKLVFENVQIAAAIVDLLDQFLKNAIKDAEEEHESLKKQHLEYLGKLRYRLDYRYSRILEFIGDLTLENGFCGYSAKSFLAAKEVEDRLEFTEPDTELKKYHHNKGLYLEMQVDKAIAFAWLERLKSKLNKLIIQLMPTDFKDRTIASLKDRFLSHKSYSVDQVRKDAKADLKEIQKMCEDFKVLLGDESEELGFPNIDDIGKDFSLPTIDYEPTPL